MNAQLVRDFVDFTKPVVRFAVGAVALIVGFVVFWTCLAESVMDDVNGLAWFIMIVTMAAFIAASWYSYFHEENFIDFAYRAADKTDDYLGPFSVWLCALMAIPVVIGLIVSQIPYAMSPDAGYLMITDKGLLLSPGNSISSPRYEMHGLSFQSWLDLYNTHMVVYENDRFSVSASVSMKVAFKSNSDLRDFVLANRTKLGLGQSSWVSPQEMTPVFTAGLEPFMKAHLAEVIRDVQEGRISGSKSGMLLRLGLVVNRDRAQLPGWVGYLSVVDVDVPNWALAPQN